MFFIKANEKTIDLFCDVLRESQEDLARNIRVWNRIMRRCGDTVDSLGASPDIDAFNERQKLLRKLVEQASDNFKEKLRPDDLKLWEELPLETRGLADPDEKGEEKSGRLISTDAAIWQKQKKIDE